MLLSQIYVIYVVGLLLTASVLCVTTFTRPAPRVLQLAWCVLWAIWFGLAAALVIHIVTTS